MSDNALLESLVEYQKAHNLSQIELAEMLHVTRETVYRWICGRAKLRVSNRRAILALISPEPETCTVKNCPFRNAEDNDVFKKMLHEWGRLNESEKFLILAEISKIKPEGKSGTSGRSSASGRSKG